jgi:hypothetical protein
MGKVQKPSNSIVRTLSNLVVAPVYNLREVALFLERKIQCMLNVFGAFFFLIKCTYVISEKFSTLNTSMQGNDTNIIVVTDKAKALLVLWVRKLEGKIFSFEGFCGGKQCGNKRRWN